MKMSVVPIRSKENPVQAHGKYFCEVNTKKDVNEVIEFILNNKLLNEFEIVIEAVENGKEYNLYFFGKDQSKEQFVEGLKLMLVDNI